MVGFWKYYIYAETQDVKKYQCYQFAISMGDGECFHPQYAIPGSGGFMEMCMCCGATVFKDFWTKGRDEWYYGPPGHIKVFSDEEKAFHLKNMEAA